MKAKLPTSVKFMSKTWKIENKELKKEYGLCDHRQLTISIKTGQPDDHLVDTLMHELVHAISFEMGIDLKEKQVAKLGTGLAHLLRTNPKVRSMFE